jgi:hypothetical protein
MDALHYYAILLAQRGRLEDLARGFRGRRTRIETDDVITGLMVLGVIALAVWILSYVTKVREPGRSYTSPSRLFLSLCRAHRLRWSERWLLWRLARAQRLRDPGRLFLEPERFEAAHLGPALRQRADQLAQLRDRLFAEPDLKPSPAGDGPKPATPDPAERPTPLFTAGPTPTLDVPPWPPTPGVEAPLPAAQLTEGRPR